MNSRQFFNTYKNSSESSRYIFIGEEEGEKERAVELIAAKMNVGAKVRRFHAENGELNSAAEVILQQDMFSEAKLFVIYGSDKIIRKNDIALIGEILDADTSGAVILVASANYPPAFVKKRKDIIDVIFWRMFESDLHNYGAELFRKSGRRASREVLSAITSLTGRDFAKFVSAVEKILSYTEEKIITQEIVVEVVTDDKEIKIFDFINSLFSGNRDSLYLLSKLINNGMHELQVLAFVWKEAERIEKFILLQKRGLTISEIMEELGVSSSSREEFHIRAKKYDIDKIRKVFIAIGVADSRIKGSVILAEHETCILNPLAGIIESVLFG